jgi:hypothetical protein
MGGESLYWRALQIAALKHPWRFLAMIFGAFIITALPLMMGAQ